MQNGQIDITIHYCAVWHHTPRAVRVTEEILEERELEAAIRSWTLVPSSGGVFEVTVNGELVFSKKALGRHAEPGEVRAAILKKLASAQGAS